MRAARKRAGKTQSDVARLLQTSQANVSKLENAMLIPSAPEWFEFCEALKIPVDSLRTGFLDMKTPVVLRSDPQEAGFRLPKRYAENRASTIRGLINLIAYMNRALGDDKANEFIESLGVDTDLLVELSNQLNLNFTYDLLRHLVEGGHLGAQNIDAVGNLALVPFHHGLLAEEYEKAQNATELIETLHRNLHHYSGNFSWGLENRKAERDGTILDISSSPQPHLKSFEYRNDPIVGDLVCRYHQSLLRKLPSFNGAPEAQLEELECHFHGADRCVYRLKFQVA